MVDKNVDALRDCGPSASECDDDIVDTPKHDDASSPQTSSATNGNIAQTPPQSQVSSTKSGGKKKTGGWDRSGCSCLSLDSKVHSCAIKCYEEQMPNKWNYVVSRIKALDPKLYQVLGICHDKDTYADDGKFWKPAFEKPHFHIIMRCVERKTRIRVKWLLDQLGIQFRPGLDDELWKEHGVETVNKSFSGYAVYLTHETEKAIAAGKERYEVSDIVSNLTPDEVEHVRQGYIMVSESARKITAKELVELDTTAYQLGYDLGNFDAWYDSLSFTARSNAKMKTIQESYYRGVKAHIDEKPEVLRLCIFIKGEKNSGKTYAARSALAGKLIHSVDGGGTGKLDGLRPNHNAILISDDICPNLLNMTDNYICQAYRRGRNNPYWAGQYFIVTSNLWFSEWLESCGIKVTEEKSSRATEHYRAMESRFFICDIREKIDGTRYLALRYASKRGTTDEQLQRLEMFKEFQQRFNSTIATYKPDSAQQVDYSDVIDPEYQTFSQVKKTAQHYENGPVSITRGELSDKEVYDVIMERVAIWFWWARDGVWRQNHPNMPDPRIDLDAAKSFLFNREWFRLQNEIDLKAWKNSNGRNLCNEFGEQQTREAIWRVIDELPDAEDDEP